MEFSQIRYFLAVADCLNFTQAADKCAVSQPALSKAIRKLEDDLGSDLLHRTTNKVQLTDFGRLMKVHFERIEETYKVASSAADEVRKVNSAQLKIGVICTINANRLVNFLNYFQHTNPHIEFVIHDVTGPEISNFLLEGKLDCVFCACAQKLDQRFAGIKLFKEDMVIAYHKKHRFCEHLSVPIIELAKEKYLNRLQCEFREEFLSLTETNGVLLNVIMNSEHEDWIFELLYGGAGVSIVPLSSIDTNKASYSKITEFKNKRIVELVMTEHATVINPALTTFQQSVCEYDWNKLVASKYE